MKINIPKNQLSIATSRAQGAISDRALAQIGLMSKDGQLIVTSSDRVLAVYSSLDCEAESEGFIFVPGRLFSDVIKQLPDGNVRLTTKGSFLVIEAKEGSEFTMKIPLIDDISWKEPPRFETTNSAKLSCALLSYMIEQVQFCIEMDSPRNYGAVGYLHKPEAGKLRLVGTDGFRLSYCDVDIDVPDHFLKKGVCLSKRALSEIHRMCQGGYEEIELSVSEDNTTLLSSVENYVIFSRLSAVKYPNYRGVLPTAKLSPVTLSRPSIQSVTRRVLLASDKTNALRLCFSQGSLTLSSKTIGSSESKEELPLADYRGASSELSINGRFLTDVFSTVSSDDLTLQFKGEEDPIVIIPGSEPQYCRSMHVLVPIREYV